MDWDTESSTGTSTLVLFQLGMALVVVLLVLAVGALGVNYAEAYLKEQMRGVDDQLEQLRHANTSIMKKIDHIHDELHRLKTGKGERALDRGGSFNNKSVLMRSDSTSESGGAARHRTTVSGGSPAG